VTENDDEGSVSSGYDISDLGSGMNSNCYNFGPTVPTEEELAKLQETLDQAGQDHLLQYIDELTDQ